MYRIYAKIEFIDEVEIAVKADNPEQAKEIALNEYFQIRREILNEPIETDFWEEGLDYNFIEYYRYEGDEKVNCMTYDDIKKKYNVPDSD
jgi:hypothetical protein